MCIRDRVKDDRHRTRALVHPDGREIGIQAIPAVFALVGQIQEETHRFAIEYHRQLQAGHMRASALDDIPGAVSYTHLPGQEWTRGPIINID